MNNSPGNIATLNLLLSREEVKAHTDKLSTDQHPFVIRSEMIDPLYQELELTNEQLAHLEQFKPDEQNKKYPLLSQQFIESRIKKVLTSSGECLDYPSDVDAIFFTGPSSGGKTSRGYETAAALGFTFIDGDTLHSQRAVKKMHNDTPLTANDREPWIQRIMTAATETRKKGLPSVIVCSALTYELRMQLRSVGKTLFIDLWAPLEELQKRANSRVHEYIQKEHSERFIQNQFDLHQANVEQNTNSDTLSINTDTSVAYVTRDIRVWLNTQLMLQNTNGQLPVAA